jgi:hypothetical protein
MEEMKRRSAMAFGLTAVAIPLFASTTLAVARTYGPNEGKELYPGVRLVEVGKWPSVISA